MKRLVRILNRLAEVLVFPLLATMAVLHWSRPALEPCPIPAPKPIEGAALSYQQAFAAMPELSGEEENLFSIYKPLDEDAAQSLLEKWATPLQLLTQGASQTKCEWGWERVFEQQTNPLLAKAQTLANIAAVRARLHIVKGENTQGVEDILTIFRFSRHLENGNSLIENATAIACNTIAMHVAAFHLRNLDRDALQKLSDGIGALPTLPAFWGGEENDRKYLQALLHNTYNSELRSPSSKTSPSKGLIASWKKTVAGMVKISPLFCYYEIKSFDRHKAEFDWLMGLPFHERGPMVTEFRARLTENHQTNFFRRGLFFNPFISILTAADSAQLYDARYQTLWTIFKTALQAQLTDPESVRAKVAGFCDPIDGTPLQMEDQPGEIQIFFKTLREEPAWQLRIGIALQREPYWQLKQP
ncbi:MAG: hypothetical protein ACFUZC_00920 [Chthoniobacteraceae bacterium]